MRSTYKKITILLAALALILMPSCSNEEGFENIPSTSPDREGVITFRIQGKRQAVSYAIATENENTVDSLEIYMFSDDSKKLQKVFRIGKTDLSQTGADLTATIDVTGRTGKHIFYFVANARGNASSLADTDAGATTEEDFRERLTDVQNGLLATPLLMTAHQVIADVATPTDDEKRVKLLRRVARFDIENDASDTNFTIGNILIEKAKQQGYAFGNATGTPTQTLATGNLPKIENNVPSDFNTGTPVASAFYLYPTTLEEGQTVILFEGEFMGERRIYSLKGGTNIEANKRYVLKAKKIDANTPEFTIEAVDWNDDGGTHEAEPKGDNVEFSAVTIRSGGTGVTQTASGPTSATYDITNIKEVTTLTLQVKFYNATGTDYVIKGDTSNLPGLVVTPKETVLTYAAHYLQEYEITIPERADKTVKVDLLVEIVNQSSPEDRLRITIRGNKLEVYPGTNLVPVVFQGITWAPVNAGATEIGTSDEPKHTGYYYQWGRADAPFVYGGEKNEPTDVYIYPGGHEWAIVNGPAKGMFIASSSMGGEWLNPKELDLWDGNKQQGPCPDGWRVPTAAEVTKIKTAKSNNDVAVTWNGAQKRYEILGANKIDTLYLPLVGFRHYDGDSKGFGSEGHYWTKNAVTEGSNQIEIRPEYMIVMWKHRAAACPVRCVKK